MDRNKQFEIFEGITTWYDEIMNRYEAAFWIHYREFDRIIDRWINEVKDCEPPRVTYYVHTEYMSMVFSELLLTIELLFKAEIVKYSSDTTIHRHNLLELMNILGDKNDERGNLILTRFEKFRELFEKLDNDKAFVNVRYMEYELDGNTAYIIKDLLEALDDVYDEFYSDFDIENLLYLGMMASMGETDFTDDEIKRLNNLGIVVGED